MIPGGIIAKKKCHRQPQGQLPCACNHWYCLQYCCQCAQGRGLIFIALFNEVDYLQENIQSFTFNNIYPVIHLSVVLHSVLSNHTTNQKINTHNLVLKNTSTIIWLMSWTFQWVFAADKKSWHGSVWRIVSQQRSLFIATFPISGSVGNGCINVTIATWKSSHWFLNEQVSHVLALVTVHIMGSHWPMTHICAGNVLSEIR